MFIFGLDFIRMYFGIKGQQISNLCNKMKIRKYCTVGTFLKSNRIIVETETKLIPLTHICDP
jgi:hypothetical protein